MIELNWIDGECNECGEKVKTIFGTSETCKGCKHIQVLERIAHVLEQHMGWS
jgi:hypothetical protein